MARRRRVGDAHIARRELIEFVVRASSGTVLCTYQVPDALTRWYLPAVLRRSRGLIIRHAKSRRHGEITPSRLQVAQAADNDVVGFCTGQFGPAQNRREAIDGDRELHRT